jgi:hypothetical protein
MRHIFLYFLNSIIIFLIFKLIFFASCKAICITFIYYFHSIYEGKLFHLNLNEEHLVFSTSEVVFQELSHMLIGKKKLSFSNLDKINIIDKLFRIY